MASASTALVRAVKPMAKTSTSTLFINNNKGMYCKILLIIIIVIATIFYVIDSSGIHINLPDQMNFKFIHLHTRDAEDPEDGGWNWQIEYDHQAGHHHNKLNNNKTTAHQESLWTDNDNYLYFVNTIGCKMPSFNVMDEHIKKFVYNAEQVHCKPSLTKSSNNYIWIALNHTEILKQYNVSTVENLHCYYQPFVRKTDKLNIFLKNKLIYFKYGDILKITDEFIKVICKYNDHQIYTDYHYFIQLKNISSIHNNNNSNNNSNNNNTIKKNRPNIMIIGLDSVSRLNFHRQMNISVDILLNKLKAIEFFGYNKVDDNTYPNLVPVLTGLDESELIDACLRSKNNTYDNCHFIWDDYKEIGYTTMFAEDMAILGLFNYLKKGFVKQPTDYNIRPVMIEMEHNIASMKKGNVHLCLGGRKPVDIILDYIKKLINLQTRLTPYFSFFWTTSYTHDFFNYPKLIDEELSQFLNNLTEDGGGGGTLNDTFLFLMSDHGIRWGDFRNTYQGMMEERQPFLFMIPPIWFRENYTMAMYNLLKNRHKLTTHYDLYETLHDLLKVSNLKNDVIKERAKELMVTEPMPRGISLLLPIPKGRTCLSAGIAPHWCTCHEKKDISTNDKRVLRVAHFIVQKINDIIKIYPQCRKISLNLIAQATIGSSNDAIIISTNKTKTSYFVDITVRLQTKPGYADFESTVRIHQKGDLELTGSISRTNLYGKQSQCVDDYKVKLYCYCDSFI